MDFANAMKQENKFTRTENGAVALNTTSDARLDLFGTIGALRDADENRITTLFSEAYAQDKLFATKIIFCKRYSLRTWRKKNFPNHYSLYGGTSSRIT